MKTKVGLRQLEIGLLLVVLFFALLKGYRYFSNKAYCPEVNKELQQSCKVNLISE
jgi:hypothetical protein